MPKVRSHPKTHQLAMFGASGRMGQEILFLAKDPKSGWSPALGISRSFGDTGYTRSLPDLKSLKGQKFADVIVDFSSPQALRGLLKELHQCRIPLVSGTTGLSKADFELLKKLGRKIPVFWAPNTSIGIAVLRRSLKSFAGVSNYDFDIEEIHHIHKKDSPSGTAKILHQDLEEVVGKKLPIPHSFRGGGVVGTHRVFAFGPEETLTFEHNALHRRVFARGALEIAIWLMKQKAGFYSMDDFLDQR
jgi:4-hydroxy-tetrahydrodipicolinate reductase